jgi:hypothetical protein
MEFGVNLGYDLIMIPRNKPFVSPSPLSKMELKWASKSGYAMMAKPKNCKRPSYLSENKDIKPTQAGWEGGLKGRKDW